MECGRLRRFVTDAVLRHQRRHAGAAIHAGNGDTIDIGFLDTGENGQRLGDLGGCDVLTLPAVGIADPVDEIEIAERVLLHQVAGAEPRIALLKNIVQDLFGRRRLVGVTLKALAGLGRVIEDLRYDLTDLAWRAFDAKAVLATHRLLGIDVETDDFGNKSALRPFGNAADGADFLIEVEEDGIAFRRCIPFQDARDAEAGLEVLPDIGPETIAAGQAQFVSGLLGMGRAVEKITA